MRNRNLFPMQYIMRHKANVSRIVLALVFILLVFAPLLTMFSNITPDNIQKVLNSPILGTALLNSFVSTAIATIITVILAYVVAWLIERSNIKFKGIFGILFVLPMLIPSISNGMGLVILFGNNGVITKMLNISMSIYGLQGIVMGSVLYAFPVAYLMFADVMKYENASPYEAADVLGINKFHRFWSITLPYLRKPLISIVFSIFTLIITDYGVPLMVGGKYTTIPVVMYQEVIGQLDFGKGAVYGCILLIPAVIAFVIDLLNNDKGNTGFVTTKFNPNNNTVVKVIGYLLCIVVSFWVLLPIFSFVIMGFAKNYPSDMTFTFENIEKAIRLKADSYLTNSIVIALIVSIIGVTVSFMTAYMTSRMKSSASRFLHLSSITSAAVPGVVLGLSYVLLFKGSFVYGTILIIVMVNIVHFISSPYLMMYNTLSKLNENLEAVGHTLGISRGYMIKDVFIPTCKGTIVEMFSYFFVNSMMTISAVSFLATTNNKPISLMINQFEAQMQLECAAIVSLIILIVNIAIKIIARVLKKANYFNNI